jgi:uncharacterized protein YbbK (DUF523 family)
MAKYKHVRNFTISQCVCPDCGKGFPIPRVRQRERGHIKDIYCPFCKDVKKHIEYRAFDFYKDGFGEIIGKEKN